MKRVTWLSWPMLALAIACAMSSIWADDIQITDRFETDHFSSSPGIGNTLILQGGVLSYTGSSSSTIGIADSSTVGFNWGTGGTINVCNEKATLRINNSTTDYYDASSTHHYVDLHKTGNGDLWLVGSAFTFNNGSISNAGSLLVGNNPTSSFSERGNLSFLGNIDIVPGYTGDIIADNIKMSGMISSGNLGNVTDSYTFTIQANSLTVKLDQNYVVPYSVDYTGDPMNYSDLTNPDKWTISTTTFMKGENVTVDLDDPSSVEDYMKKELISRGISITPEIEKQIQTLSNSLEAKSGINTDLISILEEKFSTDEIGVSISHDSENRKVTVTGNLRNQCGSPGAGVENIVNMTTGFIGTAGSQFFMGNTGADLHSRSDYRGQSQNCNCYRSGLLEGWTAWASYAYTSVEARGYGTGASHYDGYDIYRPGVLLGLRRSFDDKTSGGFIFAYTTPELHQEGSINTADNINYNSGIESTDYQLAMHLEHVFDNKWESSIFFGMGSQYMDWRRQIYGYDNNKVFQNNTYAGAVKANTFTATFYLARPIAWTDSIVLRPTIGLDSEHSYVYGFDESGTDVTGSDVNFMAVSQRFHYDRSDHSVNTGRLGLTANYVGPQQRGSMGVRCFYGVQLGGDDAAYLSVEGLNKNTASYSKRYKGLVVGQESLNLGYSMFYYLNAAKTLSASADYNAIFYKNATTQNVSAGVQYKF